jgi:hypothetical protein
MTKCELEDSWIFLAIAQSSGSPLSAFFSVADYINVAIPTDEEIERSVNRLISCGLVDVEANVLAVTAKGQEVFQAVTRLSRSPRPQVQLAVPLLSLAMDSESSKSSWHLDPAIAANARQEYFNRMKKPKSKSRKHRPEDTSA